VSNILFANYFNASQTKGSFKQVEERKGNLMLHEGEISLRGFNINVAERTEIKVLLLKDFEYSSY
jgi:hypothetical protein